MSIAHMGCWNDTVYQEKMRGFSLVYSYSLPGLTYSGIWRQGRKEGAGGYLPWPIGIFLCHVKSGAFPKKKCCRCHMGGLFMYFMICWSPVATYQCVSAVQPSSDKRSKIKTIYNACAYQGCWFIL